MIRYEPAPDLDKLIEDIATKLNLPVNLDYVICMRSYGSKARRTQARCHAMSRIIRTALRQKCRLKKSIYVIEMLAEEFEKMSAEEQIKTLIHELMHIPKAMGGGFLHHSNHVTRKNVDKMYNAYLDSS